MRWIGITCQVVTYRRLKTLEEFKMSAQKVAAYKRWSLTKGGRLQEVPTIVISH